MTTWQDTPPVAWTTKERIEVLEHIDHLVSQLRIRDSELASLRSQLANKEMVE